MESLAPLFRIVAPALMLALASCASLDDGAVTAGPVVAAETPQYRIGDRWVYRVREGFHAPVVFEETHTVTAMGADGITVRVTAKGPTLDVERVERWPAPGLVSQGTLFDVETRRFATPLMRYRFPLAPGATWNQSVGNFNELTDKAGVISRWTRVEGYDRVTTPAGTFDAVRLRVLMRLDDEEFWRWPTECQYTIWYAPAVRGVVRERERAAYLEKGGGPDDGGLLPAQNTIVELLLFTPGG